MNARIADLIREGRSEEITDAVAEGEFFQMQTFTQALIEHVLSGTVDRGDRGQRGDEPARLPRRARAGDQAQAGRATTPRPRKRSSRPRSQPRSRRPGRSSRTEGSGCASPRRVEPDAPPRADRARRWRWRCSPARLAPTPSPSSPRRRSALPSAERAERPRNGRRAGSALDAAGRARSSSRTASCSASGSRPAPPTAIPWQVLAADQQGRVELRPQHGPELGGRDRLDAVHARRPGSAGASTRTATASPTRGTRRTRSTRRRATSPRRAAPRTSPAPSSPTTTPTGT